jgi:DNA-binding transcriptional LysR family regulator
VPPRNIAAVAPKGSDGPPLLNLTVQQLAYLVAVADSATFSQAAASSGVTTSALSQGLAELERRLGLELFERVGRRQVMRDDATEVLAYARRVVADTRDLARWVAATSTGQAGQLRVGMIDAAAVDHFPAQIRAFGGVAPDVELRLAIAPSAELLEQLARGDLDLAVVVEPSGPLDAIDTEVLLTEPIVVVPPEGVPAGSPDSWGPWVLFPTGSQTRALIERELRARGAAVEVVAESHQPDVLWEMARLGMAWTVLPEAQAVRSLRRSATGPRIDAPVALTTRRLVIARRRGRTANPAADLFAAHLRG